MKRIVVFASGSGSNAENIIEYFNKASTAKVVHVLCNRKNAKVFERCKRLNIPCLYFTKEDFFETNKILNFIKETADLIVLAGFLWKVPLEMTQAFPKKILNIHPALLPNYGGKGMYGIHVHRAVFENKEKETGITIHFVNEQYDKGAIVYQAKTELEESDTPETIAQKIHLLEQRYFPRIIEEVIVAVNE
jgi:phosphoribosylglycinamide formyltransferase 1